MTSSYTLHRPFLLALLVLGWWLSVSQAARFDHQSYTVGYPGVSTSWATGVLALVTFTVFWFVFVYKAWAAIQDGKTAITPGAAVGFCFIPVFGIFWLFRAFAGYPREFNAYAERNGITGAELRRAPFLAFTIFWILYALPLGTGILFVFPVFLVLFWKVAGAMSDAITAARKETPPAGAPRADRTLTIAAALAAFGLAVVHLLSLSDPYVSSAYLFSPLDPALGPPTTLFLVLLAFGFLASRGRAGRRAHLAGLSCVLFLYWLTLKQIGLDPGWMEIGVESRSGYPSSTVHLLGEAAFWIFAGLWLFATPLFKPLAAVFAIPGALAALLLVALAGHRLVDERWNTELPLAGIGDTAKMLGMFAISTAFVAIAVRPGDS